MNASELIDKRIAELGDWRGELIARLRALVRAADPEIIEEWKWDTPVWSRKGMVCSEGAFKGAVKLNFFKGASLQDPTSCSTPAWTRRRAGPSTSTRARLWTKPR
jgi:hypothetical protein